MKNESLQILVELNNQSKRKPGSDFSENHANMACTDVRIKPNLQMSNYAEKSTAHKCIRLFNQLHLL